jgi:Protein of unknown function (DUF3999)
VSRLALAIASLLALAAPPEAFRFSRPIQALPGWVRLSLPDDVLDACRAGLPDLRIVDAAGAQVPYAFERDVAADARRLPIENLETVEKRETTGVIDRGPGPGLADAITFEIAGGDFLKPVVVEASDDRVTWKNVARGSVFAVGDVRMQTLRLPENDRRYLRFRLDDRNGDPLRPAAVVVRGRSGVEEIAVREEALALDVLAADATSESLYAASLPAANLDVTGLRFQAQDPAFSRRVRVYERIFFRDEVFRRLVVEGTLTRAPGSPAPLDLAAPGIAGRHLEIEIENGDAPPLSGLSVSALTRPRVVRFFAKEGGALRLLYGSAAARAPQYDLGRAFEGSLAQTVPEASLGPAVAQGGVIPPVPAPTRVALRGIEGWKNRKPIVLPTTPGLAYLDLEDAPRSLAGLRIVDQQGRQVPFIVERGSHEHRVKVSPSVTTKGTATLVNLGEAASLGAADAIELSASGPDYFSRQIVVEEELRDQRGVVETRPLGSARWERKPGEAAPILRIPIARPWPGPGAVIVEIENGDNAPLTIAGAWVLKAVVRLDFLFGEGDRLAVLSGNPEAGPPDYDFSMLAGVIVSAPAGAAHLEPSAETREAPVRLGIWLWLAVIITVLALVFELAKTLRKAA